MRTIVQLVFIAILSVGLTSCGKKAGTVRSDSTSGAGGASGAPAGFAGHPLDDPSSILSKKVVYFDFDRYDVHTEDQAIVAAHGGYLAANPSARVSVEGYCDERGTREYNLGLGERRSNAVQELLIASGASASQIETVSYGEERPAADCHDESCWSQNRRGVIVYASR